MIKEITASGSSIIEAKETARAALGVGELDEVQFEIIDGGTKGILGLFARPAKVRAYIELPDPVERRQKKDRKPEGQKPEHKNDGKSKRKNRPEKVRPIPEFTEQTSAPKSEVIPERELKMERRQVEAGDDMSFDFITTLLSDIGLKAEAELYSCEDGTRRITIVGEDAATLIGHHGDTLDAVQYLANLASARKNSKGERDKSRVTIDIEGYRAKREETLRALARRMAAKALRNKRSVMLEPMNAYERRIIHSEIQGIEGVSTNSIGADNNRKIVIFLTDKKPKELFEEDAARALAEAEAAEAVVEEVEETVEATPVEETAEASDAE